MNAFTIGLHFSHEQLGPSALLTLVREASQAGFARGMCSDHFHPWSRRQGQSGLAWSWLGAALEASQMSFGTVCAPGQRYHPAVIAQGAATLAEMYPGRFWLAIGSGEALNERITGQAWPPKEVRNQRLQAAADVMRRLWAGETVTTDGQVNCVEATLFSRPAAPPLLLGAALTPDTARLVAGWADGLITAGSSSEERRAVADAFRAAGGHDKPVFLQVPVAFAPTDAEALHAAHDQWRQAALPSRLLADLDGPDAFDAASADVAPEQMHQCIRVSSDIARHAAWIEEDRARGFDGVFLHNVARDHVRAFVDACAASLLPQFAAR